MSEFDAFSVRIQEVVNHKLESACRICGISVEDTTEGKKHINLVHGDGYTTYIWAEEKLTLVRVLFDEKVVRIRRIRRTEFWEHRAKRLLARIHRHGRAD